MNFEIEFQTHSLNWIDTTWLCDIIQIHSYTILYIKVQTLDVKCLMYQFQAFKDLTKCKSDFCKSFWHVLFPLHYYNSCMLMTAFRITQTILYHTKTLNFLRCKFLSRIAPNRRQCTWMFIEMKKELFLCLSCQ